MKRKIKVGDVVICNCRCHNHNGAIGLVTSIPEDVVDTLIVRFCEIGTKGTIELPFNINDLIYLDSEVL